MLRDDYGYDVSAEREQLSCRMQDVTLQLKDSGNDTKPVSRDS